MHSCIIVQQKDTLSVETQWDRRGRRNIHACVIHACIYLIPFAFITVPAVSLRARIPQRHKRPVPRGGARERIPVCVSLSFKIRKSYIPTYFF